MKRGIVVFGSFIVLMATGCQKSQPPNTSGGPAGSRAPLTRDANLDVDDRAQEGGEDVPQLRVAQPEGRRAGLLQSSATSAGLTLAPKSTILRPRNA